MKTRSGFRFALMFWVGIALAGCGAAPARDGEATPTPIPTPIVPTKPTYTVQAGEVIRKIEFSGRIAPVLEQELFFRAGGRVKRVHVQRNDLVTAGQLLAELETNTSEYDLRRAQVNVEIAQLNLELIRAQPESPSQPFEVAIKEHEVTLAQIALDELNAAVAETQLTAPFDGQLLSINLSEGRVVDGFQPIAIVADVSQLEVSAELQDGELRELSEDMPVAAQLVSRPGEAIQGAVRRLPYPYGGGGRSEGLEGEDKSVRVTLEASAGDAGVALGDLVRVTAVLERKADVLWLPPQAIRTFDGRKFVVVQDGQGQRRVDVEVGIQSPERVEIVSGLSAGQVVVGP